ncbi:MAG TPA: WecB/TagA/CpsF family glycosyltransferase [Ktedonobacterales bacterium]|jgi:N-acetylglucosaminyldiphosphoundecaprenol N-acetyl-beta-D-mannosaminyltransferase
MPTFYASSPHASSSALPSVLPEHLIVLGVRADRIDMVGALARIEALIEEHRQRGGPTNQIITLNTEFVWTARKQEAFRDTINQAALVVADGMGIVWASRILNLPFPERVAGSDLLPLLAGRCAARGFRLFLLGAAPGVAEQAGHALQQRFPGLQIAGVYAGSPSPAEAEHILGLIRAARPDVLAVAYGAPRQDLWIRQHAQALGAAGVGVALGVGGTLDFIAGRVRRAPRWVQRAGLEWAFRVLCQPRRAWRVRVLFPMGALVWAQRFQGKN